MGQAISAMPAVTEFRESDAFEIAQGGVSKKITKTQMRSLLCSDPAFSFPIPQLGDSLVFNGSDWRPGPRGGWRVVNQAAYTESAPASTSTITFAGGAAANGIQLRGGDYFAVGLPVRVEIGAGIYYYGICTAVTDTLLTMSGAILPLSTIISLAVGTPEMVKHVEMRFPGNTYNTLGATTPLNNGCIHRWRGKTGYLAAYSCSHMNTSGTTVVNLKMNGGSNVSTAGVIPAAGTSTTHGAFVDSALGDLIAANVAIADKETITAVVTTAGGTANYLVICMTFIVP
jgi:hypothetical protein